MKLNNLYYKTTQELFYKLSNLFFIVSQIIITIDAYMSYIENYYVIVVIEITVLSTNLISYIMYHLSYISVEKFASILIIDISLLILSALFITGQNPEFALFSLAILPVFIFFFLGLENGITFTIIAIFILFIALLNSYIKIIEPIIFTSSLYLEIFIAYIAISFLQYRFEQHRQGFEEQLLLFSKSQYILLKELNHRTKNNLQIIIGLFLMQSRRVDSEECKKVLTLQVNRLKAIGLVHEQLSLNRDATYVDMEIYLENIVNNLQLLTAHDLILDTEKLILDTSTATYIGLFVNEAIFNSIEHAYKPNSSDEIRVSFTFEKDIYKLIIEDYGQMFNKKYTSNSLGLLLMENISDFLDNSFMSLDFDSGTKVTLEFSIIEKQNYTIS